MLLKLTCGALCLVAAALLVNGKSKPLKYRVEYNSDPLYMKINIYSGITAAQKTKLERKFGQLKYLDYYNVSISEGVIYLALKDGFSWSTDRHFQVLGVVTLVLAPNGPVIETGPPLGLKPETIARNCTEDFVFRAAFFNA